MNCLIRMLPLPPLLLRNMDESSSIFILEYYTSPTVNSRLRVNATVAQVMDLLMTWAAAAAATDRGDNNLVTAFSSVATGTSRYDATHWSPPEGGFNGLMLQPVNSSWCEVLFVQKGDRVLPFPRFILFYKDGG